MIGGFWWVCLSWIPVRGQAKSYTVGDSSAGDHGMMRSPGFII